MIQITNKQDCCGCAACVQKCPKQCISMASDEEGFLYPKVDEASCVHCNLCEKTCPIINQSSPVKPAQVFACINQDEAIRNASSSGGVFQLLAERTINNGGVVFGACFDENWQVVHDYTDSIEGLSRFRGSKYVQSIIGSSYAKANEYLKIGREVMFTGTACQIAGLYKFLNQSYDNLITVDVLCHGVPSPMIWRDYLDKVCDKNNVALKAISFISFRSKKTGWRKFGMEINAAEHQLVCEPLDQNVFLRGFLRDLYLRPSCYNCQFRTGKSHSDITIADYWGIWNHHPQMDDDRGTSLVLLNTPKGSIVFDDLHLKKTETTYEEAFEGNITLEHSVKETPYRQQFWNKYPQEGFAIVDSICQKMRPSFLGRIKNKMISIIK